MGAERAVELVPARNGLPSLRIGGVFVHSAFDPAAEAASWARRLMADREARPGTLWVVLGCGLGYHARALCEHGAAKVVVFEPDSQVAPLRQGVAADLEDSGQVIVTSTRAGLRDAFGAHFPGADGTRIVIPPVFERLYPEAVAGAREQLDNIVQEFRVSRYTYIHQAGSWMTLTAENLPEMFACASVAALRGQADGWPAVVISAGPSLDKNIDQLAEVADRVLTLCPSQCLKAARAVGIKPDLVLVADSHNLAYHFAGCDPSDYRALVVAAKCHAEVAGLPAASKFFYYLPPNPLAEQFYRLRLEPGAELPTGASVSNIAVHLADAMGANPIILIGQDLAFAGDRMYASGAADAEGRLVFGEDGKSVSFVDFANKRTIADDHNRLEVERLLNAHREVYWVRGQDGQALATTVDMKSMLSRFERDAAELGPRRRLINATEGGALINGMEHLTFAQAVADLPRPPTDLRGGLAELALTTGGWSRVRAGLGGMRRELRTLERVAEGCSGWARKAAKRGTKDQALVRLTASEKKLHRLLARLPAINAMVQRALVQYRTMGEARDDDLIRNLDRSQVLYRAVSEAAGTLGRLLDRAIQKGAEQ
jgi:hypothetical protein